MNASKSIAIGFAFLSSLTFIASIGIEPVRSAPDVTVEGCRARVLSEMGDVRDEYRAHVFGARKVSSTRADILTGGSVKDPVKGILETKGRLTSELVSPAVESYRVLRCRMHAVCLTMQHSFDLNPNTSVQISDLGCADRSMRSYGECSFTQTAFTGTDRSALESECGSLFTQSMKTERSVLLLAFGYDSGYRSGLQLSGMIDWFQGDFPDEVLKPIRDMVSMLGKLHEIPCFIGQCDLPIPPPPSNP